VKARHMASNSLSETSHASLLDSEKANNAVPPSRIFEQALTLAAMGDYKEAIIVLRDVTARAPGHAPAWEKLSELLRFAGIDEEARTAKLRAAGTGTAWAPACDLRSSDEIVASERVLSKRIAEMDGLPERLDALHEHLRRHETDAVALRLLGRLELERGDPFAARALFERAVDLAPDYEGARANLAQLLRTMREDTRALAETTRLIALKPANMVYRALHADALRAIGDVESAIPIIEQMIREESARPRFRCVLANALRVADRPDESVREFRTALDLQPGMGEAYWGLAELRGNILDADDIADMRQHLRRGDENLLNRFLLQSALGLALERAGKFADSFAAYEAAAAVSQEMCASSGEVYNSATEADQLARRRAVFAAYSSSTSAAPTEKPDSTPIFVVGLPRAGSTLVEQILASHSLVEGLSELPALQNLVRDLSLSRRLVTPDAYPECVRDLNRSDLAELGSNYLRRAAAYRKTGRPYFVDKQSWNWREVGLIRLILPHAKIVDVRREPMAACFAMYKHMQANDATNCDFKHLAHYYTQYVGMMNHLAGTMPGHIHYLSYEQLVENPTTEIRRLLEYCGLPFEDGCLRFWETSRVVATPSSQQVRQPIFRDALEQWRNFEFWLGPLKDALKAAQADAKAQPQPDGYDYALTLAAMSMYEAATEKLLAITRRVPAHPGVWLKLAELLRFDGEDKAADQAINAGMRCAAEASKWRTTSDPRTPGQLELAERELEARISGRDRASQMDLLREHLYEEPTDSAALRQLSSLEYEEGDGVTALNLSERALLLSPFYNAARAEYAVRLMRGNYFAKALEQTKILLRQAPGNREYHVIRVDALIGVGEFVGALAMTDELLDEYPRNPRLWYRRGKLLHYLGRRDDSAEAYRTCLDISPQMGEAWWGLADLKGSFLSEADAEAMRAHLRDASLDSSSRMYIYYALGHTLERIGDFTGSFTAYLQGARLCRGDRLGRGDSHSDEDYVERLQGIKRVYTARNLALHAMPAEQSPAVTPIFIVGMPRAGSTLTEQILASHSAVEGTRELPLIGDITHDLALSRRLVTPNAYPDCIMEMLPAHLAALGERYLREARPYRKTERPFFIDKRPWNWMEVGLIHLILPQAKIIDIRREPMAACFAMFKQVFLDSSDFSNSLHDLGRYYVGYADLMEYWQAVLPGRVHFVRYERLVEDTENEIRRMLDYCGLPFEGGCLRFWETKRAVTTPSAAQVRRPIYRDALEQWRNYEPWLAPLKAALSTPAPA
jgi:tetratricopeptide (TPR) repeat protein